jgi:hypothetical protein
LAQLREPQRILEEIMRRIALLSFLIGLLLSFSPLTSAHAQATRTWVSGVGDDVNPCSRTAPCKTFAGAISKTANNGEINCLDSGGFGTVTITKSISILCDGVVGGVLAAGTNGINVNDSGTAAPGSIVVYLEGLDFDGAGSGLIGINFTSGASLHVKNSKIRNFNSGSGHGINFAPSQTAVLIVENTTISDTGAGAVGAAIVVRPAAAVSATALISKVHAHRGNFGIVGDGSGGTTGINITVRDTAANAFKNTAFLTTTSGPGVGLMVHNSSATNSATGLSATGGSTIRIGGSVVTGNGTSVNGNVLSFGDNRINGNGVDTIPAAVPGGLH